MKHSMLKLAIVAMALATAVACNKKTEGASVSAGRDARVSGTSGLPTGQGSSAGTQSAQINFSQSQAATMKQAVQILVSTTIDPLSVGDIQSVEVSGNVGVQNGTGQVLSDSTLQIVIRDNAQSSDGTVLEPIVIRIRGASGTAVGYQANLVFSDEYGTITVTGTYNQSTFTGNVRFSNTAGNGFNGSKTGGLGQFTIPTCAFFRCM